MAGGKGDDLDEVDSINTAAATSAGGSIVDSVATSEVLKVTHAIFGQRQNLSKISRKVHRDNQP